MTTPRVTVPVEPTPLSVCQAIAPYLGAIDQNDWSGLDDDDAISMPVKMRVGDLRDLKTIISAAPAPEGVAVPFDREGLIALIMEETTDDIVADGWDRLGKPNVLVQGCRYIRRNSPPSPEGYENPEASAKQFAGFIADRILKALATREEAPAEAGERNAISALFRDFGRCVPYASRYAFEKAANSHADAVLALRAQPPHLSGRLPKEVTIFCPKCALRNGHEWRPRPFATVGVARPAPDALREDSQAWGMLADLVSWFTKPVQGQNGMVWVIPAGDQGADDAVAAALAALQAEQKGGAA